MLFKEFPYNRINKITLFNEINSGKCLKLSEDSTLNDLIEKMFKINVNERISLDDYCKHYFFYQNKLDFPNFNFSCDKRSKNINNCCIDCTHNICKNYLEEHKNHWFK
jgi:serine/threonine protein kinase